MLTDKDIDDALSAYVLQHTNIELDSKAYRNMRRTLDQVVSDAARAALEKWIASHPKRYDVK